MKKVMIVEDQLILATLFEAYVGKAGFQSVGIATTCTEAMEIFDRENPDLVLMDIQIDGDKDGIETIKILLEKHIFPFVFLTGNNDEATRNKAMETHPNAFLLKPVSRDVFIETISKILAAA